MRQFQASSSQVLNISKHGETTSFLVPWQLVPVFSCFHTHTYTKQNKKTFLLSNQNFPVATLSLLSLFLYLFRNSLDLVSLYMLMRWLKTPLRSPVPDSFLLLILPYQLVQQASFLQLSVIVMCVSWLVVLVIFQ